MVSEQQSQDLNPHRLTLSPCNEGTRGVPRKEDTEDRILMQKLKDTGDICYVSW